MEKCYIDNSTFLELSSELADIIVKSNTTGEILVENDNGDLVYTEEAQDAFNDAYDLVQEILNDFGVHSLLEKDIIISGIKDIISDYGEFSIADIEAEASPLLFGGDDSHILAERFLKTGVSGVNYVNGVHVSEDYFDYEELNIDTLEEIFNLAKEWDKLNEE